MTKTEQMRLAAWRSRLLRHAAEDSQSVARTCRHFGVSRKTFYKWRRRLAECGEAGLADRPRTPQRSPRALAADIVSKILYLRQHYHFGLSRIASYLVRFHQVVVARSSVHRTLKRHGDASPARQPEAPATLPTLAAVRETPARASPAARGEVPRADRRFHQAALSIHGHR